MKIMRVVLSALVLGGCAADAVPVGGDGAAPVVAGERPLKGADDAHPCGAATVADVSALNGNRIQLCVIRPGVEAFVETGPTGRDSAVKAMAPTKHTSALEILLATTGDDVAVPRALLAGAEKDIAETAVATRKIVDGPVTTWAGEVGSVARTNYCGAAGATQFKNAECFHCDPYDDCDDWCITDLWGWHDRNFYGWMGDEGNVGIETTAACTGQVRVRAFYAEDAGDAWETEIDKTLNAGTSSTYGLIYHSVAIFGQDYDIRLRAESKSGGGVHRHSGYFLDE
jgi:hypothetical protein